MDVACVVTPKSAEAALDSALGQGLTIIERVAARASDLRGPSRLRSGSFANIVDVRLRGMRATDSELETDFLALCRRFKLPMPQVQCRVAEVTGERGRVDFVYPEARLLIEVDGYHYHRDLDPFRGDRRRDRRAQLAGWVVLRYTWWDIHEEPAGVAAEIRAFLYPQLGSIGSSATRF